MSSSSQNASPIYDMGELLDSMEPMKPLRRGDVVEGVVMRADPDGIFINIGHKAEGIVPPGEMRSLDAKELDLIEVGDDLVTLVVRAETAEHGAVLSIDRAVGEKGWRVLEKAMESDSGIEGKILGFNRGGAIAEAEGIQGFVPMSQLVSIPKDHLRQPQEDMQSEEVTQEGGDSESADKDAYDPRDEHIGKILQLKVLEVNRSRNRAIFSERQAMQDQRDEQKSRLIEELTEGEVRAGRVTGISSFGAFVDLGGADGLVHISELSWDSLRSPEEVVKIGDELDVYVLRVDAENKRIALSLKRLQPEPWDTINERHQVGDIVDATVTKLTNFGAFARVEGSVEGLIHISELSSKVVNHPRDVVREGDSVKLKILRIELERRRLRLSLKEALEEMEFPLTNAELGEESASAWPDQSEADSSVASDLADE